MAKSRAQIQREYRQRLKERDNEGYLAKERERRRRSYIPSENLSRKERTARNAYNRNYLRVYRAKKKEAIHRIQQENLQNIEVASTSGYESALSPVDPSNSDIDNRMIVQLRFQKKANGPKMRISKELSMVKLEMKDLQEKYDNLKRKYRTNSRSLQRMKRQKVSSPSTPRSKTENMLKEMRLSKEQKDRVRKELIFANAICHDLKAKSRNTTVHKRNEIASIVAGKTIKKYRLLRKLGMKSGLNRNKLSKLATKKETVFQKISRKREISKNKDKVPEFLKRDDNSRNMPGKGDFVKTDNKKEQKRILVDYLGNLYQKFMSENNDVKLSFTSFSRIRPRYIMLTSFIRRDTCLCTKHQNMSLTLKAIKRQNISVSLNAEKEIENKENIVKNVKSIDSEEIEVNQWQRVPIEEKGKKKMIMKIVAKKMKKDEFSKHVGDQFEEFQSHVLRIKTQFAEIKTLKENLPANHCVIHMDFAENYACKTVEEIQSAYWNQTGVTVHPAVVYYRTNPQEELKHKSIVFISNELGHNSNTVVAIIDRLLEELKSLNLTCVHYVTDSPTSQYRNKSIFHVIANHKDLYGITAKWNYWEAGHGKGPCDGLGGLCKRMADEAVNSGKATIQDALDFFAWTQSDKCSLSSVKFIFLSKEDCEQKTNEMSTLQLKPVQGTMKIHAVAGLGNSTVAVRNTSCYCQICLSESFTCQTWREESVSKSNEKVVTKIAEITDTPPSEEIVSDGRDVERQTLLCASEKYSENDFVIAAYDNKYFVGQLTEIDDDDDSLEISFMVRKKLLFQWPNPQDIIWIEKSAVVCKIDAPIPSGRSGRMWKFNNLDINQYNIV